MLKGGVTVSDFSVVDVMFPLSSILFRRMRGNGERLLESYSM